ncbi:MAG TPA: UMP kinase [Candidatus Fimimonas merdipullorum]|uniref:Uridylate kinase n=1 Tax=Candidatus Fimimonas merdipullorum TaxID=2840822 RepID=A0A9D1MX25_9BACT|nr:UMP kinase [Candidatus Fimimonas merdipullorum]
MVKYDRILIKVSGEALSAGSGIDANSLARTADTIKQVAEKTQVAVVVGGGNFWRGRTSENMDRVTADNIGMLATVMNALALGSALTACGVKNKVFSAVTVNKVLPTYVCADANKALDEGYVVVFGGGTGAPFFTTDTAAALRACEIGAKAIFCAKAVDGVYDSDPKTNPNAKKYDEITFDKAIADNLKALDVTAMSMCREYSIPVAVFSKDEPKGILRILDGEKLGTIIK